MSQHLFPVQLNGKTTTVLIGWDRPCRGFFMVVGPHDEAPIYSNTTDLNLVQSGGMCSDVGHFENRARALGFEIPESIVMEVCNDQWLNVGNRFVNYDAAGNTLVPA